jgi:hypothetical protein
MAKLSPFEQAFADARADGKKTFSFNGKTYGTTTSDDVQKKIDAMPSMSRQSGPTITTQGATYPKASASKPKDKDSEPSEMVKGFRAARDKFGDTPFVDTLMDAGKVGMGLTGGKLLTKIPADLAAGIASSGALHAGLGALGYATASDQGKKEVRDMLGFKKGGTAKQYTKGGKINLNACGVSTHVPNKKNSNW